MSLVKKDSVKKNSSSHHLRAAGAVSRWGLFLSSGRLAVLYTHPTVGLLEAKTFGFVSTRANPWTEIRSASCKSSYKDNRKEYIRLGEDRKSEHERA